MEYGSNMHFTKPTHARPISFSTLDHLVSYLQYFTLPVKLLLPLLSLNNILLPTPSSFDWSSIIYGFFAYALVSHTLPDVGLLSPCPMAWLFYWNYSLYKDCCVIIVDTHILNKFHLSAMNLECYNNVVL